METQDTLKIDELELRKTEEGWQYLSEGFDGHPDRWCDATSVLGPFGGSGVNDLLDELATARARNVQLTDALEHIRGKSSCSDAWDLIDKVML